MIALVLVHGIAHAGELDDIAKLPMGTPGTMALVDAGKAPLRALAFHFKKGARRKVHGRRYETTGGTTAGEPQQAPPKRLEGDVTFVVAAVAADGSATVEMSAGGSKSRLTITPQGATSGGVIAGLPGALPTDKIGVGARWNIYSTVDLMGVANPSITAVTVVAIDGDKIRLHMAQDIRLDLAALASTMGGGTLDSGSSQNVADLTLDLGSPGLVGDATQISVTHVRGAAEGKPFDAEFVATAITGAGALPPRISAAVVGTWKSDGAKPITLVFRADGTGTFDGQAFRWKERHGKLALRYADIDHDIGWDVTFAGDLMIEPAGDNQVVWRRTP